MQPGRTGHEKSLLMQLAFVGSFLFIVLMLFALAESIYRDTFQVGGYIEQLKTSIEEQKAATSSNKDELAYAENPRYQEKMGKELLGLKAAGEEVYIVGGEVQSLDDLLPKAQQAKEDLLTNPQKWLKFLFGI